MNTKFGAKVPHFVQIKGQYFSTRNFMLLETCTCPLQNATFLLPHDFLSRWHRCM